MEVRIQNGVIRGTKERGTWAFKGIPFAKPPTGTLRFKPPEPCEDWFGTLDCTRYGPRPCQIPPPWCLDRDSFPYGEDCLNLNVWTPAADSRKRPVVFHIYGGGHMEGSNSELGREGYQFSPSLGRERDLVVVAPNYRVGPFGYLYLAHLLGDSYAASGSLGLLDQILALQWVRDNISFLGGNPENVTIAGQSAGGKSVCNLLLAPSAQGLYHRAVAMSGALQSITDIETDKALTANFLHALGLEESQAETLLTLPAAQLSKAIDVASQIYFKAESYGPTADGVVLPLAAEDSLGKGAFAAVPVVLGHTKEELYPPVGHNEPDPGEDTVYRKLMWKYGDNAGLVMERYRTYRAEHGYAEAYGWAATEYTYVQPYLRTAGLLTASGYPVYLYRWDYAGGLRANHSSDNEALFGATDPGKQKWNPEKTAAVDRLFQELIYSFVTTGKPAAAGCPEWHPYTAGNRSRLLIDVTCRPEAIDIDRYDKDFPLQVFHLRGE